MRAQRALFLLLGSLGVTSANLESCRSFDVEPAARGGTAGQIGNPAESAGDGNKNPPIGGAGHLDVAAGAPAVGGAEASTGGQPLGPGGEDEHGGNSGGGIRAEGGAAGEAARPGPGDGGSGDVAGAAGAPDTFPTLSGLSLWLESDPSSLTVQGADQRVSAWRDSSGNGNDAGEPDTARQPRLTAVNGHPAVTFDRDPSNLIVGDSLSLQLGTAPFTLALVLEWTNSPNADYTIDNNITNITYNGYGGILTKVQSASPYDGLALFANFAAPFISIPTQRRFAVQLEVGTALAVSGATNLNDGVFRLYVVQRNAGLLDLRMNRSPQGHIEFPSDIDVSAPGKSLFLGGSPTVPLRGAIAEVVIVKGAVNDEALHSLEKYLMAKFTL